MTVYKGNFKCRVCGCEEYSFAPGNVTLYQCNDCNVIFIHPGSWSLQRKLTVEYLDNYKLDEWGEIEYKHLYDSGADLRAAIEKPVTILPYFKLHEHYSYGENWINEKFFPMIPFGIKIQPSEPDMDVKIFPRSGLGLKKGVVIRNNVGIIDNMYRGEVMGKFVNLGYESYIIEPGERVAQMIVTKRLDVSIVKGTVNETVRGVNGLGSTGKI